MVIISNNVNRQRVETIIYSPIQSSVLYSTTNGYLLDLDTIL